MRASEVPAERPGRPASAGAMNAGRLSCGDMITRSTALTADVGPCPGDGIIIGADNITLNLNGHTIFGTQGPGDGNAAGVRLPNRRGVTVTGQPGRSGRTGTITGFDAGVVVNRGSGNRVENLTVRDNIGPDDANSTLGDGVVIFNSAGNQITNNSLIHNGVFDGIGVLGRGSDDNLLQGNRVEGTVGSAADPAFGFGAGIVVNHFLDVEERGFSIYRNRVEANTVVNNEAAGVSNISNVEGQVINNTIEHNGLSRLGSFSDREGSNGIGIQRGFQADPATKVLVKGNRINHNGIAGVLISQGTAQNVVEENTAIDNGAYGIAVIGTDNRIDNNVTANAGAVPGAFDLYDNNPGCDNNEWFGNTWTAYTYPGYEGFGSYYPECTGNGGSGPRPGLEVAFGG